MQWDQWIRKNAADGGLLQSEGWAEFQYALDRRVEQVDLPATSYPATAGPRLGGGKLQALVVEHSLPFGQSYVYSPRGPVFCHREPRRKEGRGDPEHSPDDLDCFVALLFAITKEVRKKFPAALFWRIEPTFNYSLLTTHYSLRRAPRDVQPATTLVIDLSKSEEELLVQMKQKTRYNVKLAQRHGIFVQVISNDQFLISNFLELLDETAKRDGFRPHTRRYYETLMERGGSTELFCAFHNNQLLAGAIVAFFGQWTYYLHGASSNEHREMMAPYLLHWEIMREAKRRGCTKYDFWGVGEKWPGVSKFKTGFAPATALTHYPGTFDVVFRPLSYWLYRVAASPFRSPRYRHP